MRFQKNLKLDIAAAPDICMIKVILTLLFVACLMLSNLADIEWHDFTECAPAVVCAIAMPLSFSIADGIGLAFLTYVVIKKFSGKSAECPVAVYVLAVIFGAKFAFF